MSIRVQDSSQVQSLLKKLKSPTDEQITTSEGTPDKTQKQLVSFQGAQALKAITLTPSFKGTSTANPNFKDTLKATMKSDKIPEITMKTGKFNPSAEIIDKELGIKVIMLGGSKIEGDEFKYKLPGICTLPGDDSHKLSFSGNSKYPQLALTTFNLEPRTVASVEEFKAKGLHEQVIMGDEVNTVNKYKPAIVIPAGGFGTRFLNISGEEENKPSSVYPGGSRVIDNALSLASSAGILNDKTSTVYLSQAGKISGENIRRINERLENGKLRNIEDGGGIAEALAKNILSSNKDMIILNADIFTNADITKAYHALKTLPDAALVIPYYPVTEDRAKSFGLIGVKQDNNGNCQIKNFIEKPSHPRKEAQAAYIPETGKYMANPGMYFLSKQVVKKLKEKGIDVQAVGLGAKFVPEIVEMCNNGEITNSKGKPMKVYTVPLQAPGGKDAIWDDVGSAEAYVSMIREVAHETTTKGTGEANKYYGIAPFILEDFTKAVDLKTGVICGEKEKPAFEKFKAKYGITKEDSIKGNVLVLPLNTK